MTARRERSRSRWPRVTRPNDRTMESKAVETSPEEAGNHHLVMKLARQRLSLIQAAAELINRAAMAPGNLLGCPSAEWADGRASASIECALAAVRFAHVNCELEVQTREKDSDVPEEAVSDAITQSKFKEGACREIMAAVGACALAGGKCVTEREPDTDRAAEDHAEGGA